MIDLEILDKSIRRVPDFPKSGIMFYDVTSIFTNPPVFKYCIDKMLELCKEKEIDGIAGIESRGFLFAAPLAEKLGLPLVLIRKKGKLPGKTYSCKYSLEYGTAEIEVHKEDIIAGKNYLVVDDLIATGTDLYKNRNLFDKDYDGQYNTNEIVEEIGAFIKDYNDLVISAENTKSSGIESAMKTLEGITDAYKKDLAEIGITVDKEDGTLNFDEESFLKSDMKDVKSLFIGTGSFAYQSTLKATMVANQAETEANKANTYTDDATYGNNHNTGSIFDGII